MANPAKPDRPSPRLYFLDPHSRDRLLVTGQQGKTEISLDLWQTTVTVVRKGDWFALPDGSGFPLPGAELLKASDQRSILVWRDGAWEKWQYTHPESGRLYKPVFVGAGKPPTVELSGIKMHITENGDPLQDTRHKLKALGPVRGRVLDLCTGLGYTAIALARRQGVKWVLTVEFDSVMLQLCRENPWSRPLFTLPNLSLLQMDAARLVQLCPEASFQGILHDPPRFSLAPQLYSQEFYQHCYRILRTGGRLYHYTGSPGRLRGRDLPGRTAARLKQVGFSRVHRCYQGVCARKG